MNCFGNIKLKMRLRDGRDQSNTTQLKIPVNNLVKGYTHHIHKYTVFPKHSAVEYRMINLAKGCGTVKLRLIAKLLSCRPQIINLAKGCT